MQGTRHKVSGPLTRDVVQEKGHTMIRRATGFLLLVVFMLAPAGCGPSGPSPEEKRIQQLEREKAQLTEEKHQEEDARGKAEQDKSRWQFYTILAACASGVLLVLGAGLGSSARKEAEARKQEEKRKTEDEK